MTGVSREDGRILGRSAVATVAMAVLIVGIAAAAIVPPTGFSSSQSLQRHAIAAAASAEPEPSAEPATRLELADMGWFTLGGTPEGERQYLYVGRLDGKAYRAVVADGRIAATGPSQGRVLAWWRDGDRSVVVLVDTADGSSRVVLESDEVVDSAAFGPDNDFYWISRERDGADNPTVWRSDLVGGNRERLDPSLSGTMAFMTPSDDLQHIAVWSISDDGSRSYQVLDTDRRTMTAIPVDGFGDVIGFLGSQILVYAEDPTDEGMPIVAISADGEARTLAHTQFVAAVYRDAEGTEHLVHDSSDHGRYVVFEQTEDSTAARAMFAVAVADFFEGAPRLMARHWGNGIETRGWVPILPGGGLLHDASTDAEEFSGVDRLLVSLDGTTQVDLGPEPEVQPSVVEGRWGGDIGIPPSAGRTDM
jgi:hypothetical protein